MKTIYLNIQSKGGSGKSMFTYLQALKYESNEDTAFVDLDSSTQTSKRQLKFLVLKKTNRVIEVSIIDKQKKIEREKLFQILEALNQTQFKDIYVDFGASESEQLPSLFSLDFSIDDFKEFEKGLDAKIIFNVIIAGGTAYVSTLEYLQRVTALVEGKFEIYAWINEFTFFNYSSYIEEVKKFVTSTNGWIQCTKCFGNINTDRSSGQLIIENVREGKGIGDFNSFASKTIIKRELAKI